MGSSISRLALQALPRSRAARTSCLRQFRLPWPFLRGRAARRGASSEGHISGPSVVAHEQPFAAGSPLLVCSLFPIRDALAPTASRIPGHQDFFVVKDVSKRGFQWKTFVSVAHVWEHRDARTQQNLFELDFVVIDREGNTVGCCVSANRINQLKQV